MNKLVRDVGINVVANLIAAAIIYLAGVATGIFTSVPGLIGLAIATVVGAAVWAERQSRRATGFVLSTYIQVVDYSFVLVPLLMLGYALTRPRNESWICLLYTSPSPRD